MRIGLRCLSCINQSKRRLELEKENLIDSESPNLSTCSGNQNRAMCLDDNISSKSAHSFSYRELAIATKNFRDSHLLGEGGFGKVYKGRLENGQVIAVKRLNLEGFQGNQEFIIEVLMLNLLHHSNLVTLIGYCAEGDQRLLVYEYMSRGTLADHLYEDAKDVLDWRRRVKIAAGASRGLEHLHCKANPAVIYRDLKSANILLDDGFNPKLSDFGLAKLGPVGDQSHVSTRVMGTYGYCAPEYALSGKLTLKSDIYSFGVVLLELVTGKKAYDFGRPHGKQSLVAWSQALLKDKKRYTELVDERLKDNFSFKSARHMIAVTAMCLHEDPSQRPLISEIVSALDFLASEADD